MLICLLELLASQSGYFLILKLLMSLVIGLTISKIVSIPRKIVINLSQKFL